MTTATATQLGTAGIQSILDKIAEYGVTTTLPAAADITRIDVDGGDVTIHTATDTYDVALNSDMEMDFINLRLNALSIINFDESVPADQFDILVHDGTGFAPAPQSELDIEWTQLNNVPTEFTPEAHTHPISDITNLQTELDGKSDNGHTHVKADITDLNEADYATAAQGATADSATQPGDNISTLTNDSNFIDASGAPIQSVNGYTGTVTLGQSDVGLANVNNTSDLNKPISTATQTALDGKADLVGGKLSNSQVPDLAISNFLGSVSNESAMLTLSGQAGDWALRTDTDVMYILTTTGGSTLTDWQSISYPTAPVQTVNGQTGNVVLAASDVNALASSDIGVTVQGYDANTVVDANYVATDENFTTADHSKLDGIAAGAEVNVQANWTETDSGLDSFIQNKPTLGTASAEDTTAFATAAQGTTADSALQPGDIGVSVQGYNANTVIDGNYVATDENFTTTLKNKLDGIAIGAEVNVNADWNAVSGDSQILNKPTLGTAAASDTTDFADATHFHVKADITDFSDADYAAASHTHTLADITDSGTAAGLDAPATGDAASTEVVKGDDSRLTDNRDPNAHTHDTADITTGTFANARIAQGNVTQYQGNLSIDYSQLTSVPSDFTPSAHTHTLSEITDSGTSAGLDVAASGDAAAGEVVKGDDTRLTDARTPVAHTHVLGDITDFDANDYATGAEGDLATTALQPGAIGVTVQGYDANIVSDAAYVRTDENFTTADHTKLDGIAAGAEVNVNADWNAISGDAEILNKPTLGTAAATDSTDYAPAVHTHVKADITDFSDADYAAASHTHAISDITNLQTELDGKVDESREGVANGIATLDANGLVPSSQLPSYVDDVLEYANEASFPGTGETGKLYVDLSDNSVHRWSGTAYVNITDYSTPGHTHTLSEITDFNAADYATGAEGDLATTSLQPGDIGVSVQAYDANIVSDATYVATDENFTTADHSKLDGIQAGAEVNVNADWNAVSGDAEILNKPTLGTAAATDSTDYATAAQGTTADSALQPTDIGTTVQGYNVNTVIDANYVATDQNFTNADHTKLDGIAAGAEVNVNADWTAVGGDAEILNKPTLGTAAATDASDYATAAQGTLADSATQPGDNVSTLTNDANYITSASAPVQSVNGQTGTVSLASDDLSDVTITSAQAGDAIVYDGAGFVNAAPTVIIDVHNDSGSTITKATPVYVSGTHASGKPTIALADSNGAGTYPAIGLVYADVANGADGRVMVSGVLTNLDTNTPGYSAGDALYVSSTAGDLTNTRPTASSEKVQKVALCTRAHVSAGSLLVMGAGRTNDVNNELTALTGVALNATDLGTFTGSTATDNSNIKTVLQDLETAVEGKADTSHTHATTDITSGTFADARIAQTNVTQHEGALSVDWTQLTSVPSTFTPSAHTHTLSEITDAGTAAGYNVSGIGDASLTQVVKGSDTRLTDARTPTSHTHPISEITDLQTTLDGKALSTIDLDTVASNGNSTLVDLSVGHGFTVGGHSANADIRLNGDGAASITFDTDTTPGTTDVAGLYRIDASGNSERFLTATDNNTILESEGGAAKVIIRGSKNGAGDTFDFAEFGWNDSSINGPVTIRNAAGTDLYTLPTADGTANQIIQTNGSGTLSFVDAPTGGGGASVHKEWVGRSILSSSEDTHYMLPGGFATGLSDDIPYEASTLSTIAAVAKGHGHVIPAGTYSGTISLETAVGNSTGSSGSIPYDGGSLTYFVYRTSYSGSTATWNQVATGTITCAANSEEFVNTDITITSEAFAAGDRLNVVLKGVESISSTTYVFWGYSADLTED